MTTEEAIDNLARLLSRSPAPTGKQTGRRTWIVGTEREALAHAIDLMRKQSVKGEPVAPIPYRPGD